MCGLIQTAVGYQLDSFVRYTGILDVDGNIGDKIALTCPTMILDRCWGVVYKSEHVGSVFE